MLLRLAIIIMLTTPTIANARIIEIPKTEYLYFTHYDLVKWQTDNDECHWASWKDLCKLRDQWIQTIALTSDKRKQYWIKRWDTVKLIWDKWCAGTYQVHDEMWKRFRTKCIKRSGVCVKGDLPWKPWWICYVKL